MKYTKIISELNDFYSAVNDLNVLNSELIAIDTYLDEIQNVFIIIKIQIISNRIREILNVDKN